jgi:hypothetical protein
LVGTVSWLLQRDEHDGGQSLVEQGDIVRSDGSRRLTSSEDPPEGGLRCRCAHRPRPVR